MEVLQVEWGSLCGEKLVLPGGSGRSTWLMTPAQGTSEVSWSVLLRCVSVCLSLQELLKSVVYLSQMGKQRLGLPNSCRNGDGGSWSRALDMPAAVG